MDEVQELKRKLGSDSEALAILQRLEKKLKGSHREPQTALAEFHKKYGLVQVHVGMPPYDKFQSGQMDSRTSAAVHACFGKQGCWNASIAYDDAQQQDNIHALMILGFRPFTRSSSDSGKFELQIRSVTVKEMEDDMSLASSEDSNTEHHSSTEEKVYNKLYVFSKKFVTLEDPDGKILRAVCGSKRSVMQEHLFQAASYAMDDLLDKTKDLDKRYRPPVYLEMWDALNWFYGILEVDYFVQITNGEISEASLQQFPQEKTSVPMSSKFTATFTQDEVKDLLSKWKHDFDAEEMPQDRWCPVGRLYMKSKRFPLPRYNDEAIELTTGAKRFYEGNLKVLVGKRISGWTPKNVLKAFYSRDEEQKALHDQVGAPIWVKEVLFPKVDIDQLLS